MAKLLIGGVTELSLGRVVESEVGTKHGFGMPDRRGGWAPDKGMSGEVVR